MSTVTSYWVRRNRLQVTPDEIRPEDYVQVYVRADVDTEIEGLRRDKQITDSLMVEGSQKIDELRNIINQLISNRRNDALDGQAAIDLMNNQMAGLQQQLATAQARVNELEHLFNLSVSGSPGYLYRLNDQVNNLQRQLAEARGR